MRPVPSTTRSTSGTARSRLLLLLLGLAVVVFAFSLPWQMRQWAETGRLNEEARLREGRVQKLQQQQQRPAASATALSSPGVSARLQAAADLAQRAGTSRGAKDAAVSATRQLEQDAARSAAVADAVSDLYQQIGYVDRALAMARLSQRLAPNAPGPLLRLGYIETALGHPKIGISYFQQAAKSAPPPAAEPQIALALAFDQTGDARSAESALRKARQLQPRDWRTAILLATNLTNQRRYPEAESVYSEAIRIAPDEPQPYLEQAAFLLERAEKPSPEDAMATAAATPKLLTEARKAAARALLLDPNNTDARFLLGRIYARTGAYADAQREWEQVLAIAPNYPNLRGSLGRLLLRNGDKERGQQLIQAEARDAAEAAEFNRLVIRAGNNPESIALRRDLARWSLQHGKLSRAILEWQEVLARVPADREAQQQLQAALRERDSAP